MDLKPVCLPICVQYALKTVYSEEVIYSRLYIGERGLIFERRGGGELFLEGGRKRGRKKGREGVMNQSINK